MSEHKEPRLENIQGLVSERVKQYYNLDLLQQFAMFMGKAQVLELTLKNVLARRYGYDYEEMERWTLGRVNNELRESGVRQDFTGLLETLIDLRNYIAHELLAAEIVLTEAISEPGGLNIRHLQKGIWQLEQILIIVDWQERHDAWSEQQQTSST